MQSYIVPNKGNIEDEQHRPGNFRFKKFMRFVVPPGNTEIKVRIIFALICLAASKSATVLTPLLFGKVVDHISGPRFDINVFWWLLGGYGLVRLGQELFQELKQLVFTRVTQRAVHQAASAVFRHLHSLSLGFHLNRKTGALVRAADRGVKSINSLLGLTFFEILPVIIELLLVGFILWKKFSIYYMLVTIGAILFYIAITVALTEWRLKFRKHLNDADEDAATHAIDSLLNYETVKHFNAEAYEAKRYESMLDRYETAAVKLRTSLSLVNFVQGLIITIGLVAVMGLAGHDISKGTLSVGDFVAVVTFLMQLYLPLGFVGMVYREIRSSITDMGRVFDLLDIEPEIEDMPGSQTLVVKGGGIEFDGVTFSYGDRVVLSDVSFEVPPGKKVAIVGRSGAGKSTIARLLLRFYEPLVGTIRIDGQDIRTVRQTGIRNAIGIVPQDTILFNDTIGRNIAFGNNAATPEMIEEAAGLASLDRLIDHLPARYDTIVGERGLKLSGGEKQRVAIARAAIKSPAILLFDEATSSLDSRTESDIRKALERVRSSRTTLVIAHRLSTVLDADNIIVLSEGRVAEQGSHDVLLSMNGIYADMWRQQQAAKRDESLEE